MTMKRRFSGALIATAVFALSSQSAMARSNVAFICPELDKETGELSVRVDTGCKTGMARFDTHDLRLVVDQNYARITVEGSIKYHPLTSPIVTADCGGARQFTLTASNIEARRYSVSYNDRHLGISDLVEGPSPACLWNTNRRVDPGATRVNRSDFADWSGDPVSGWQEWRSDDVLSLIQPLLSGHPETDSGLQTAEISIDRRVWGNRFPVRGKPWRTEPFVAVSIKREGFRDDSVSGDRYFAELRLGEDGWRVEQLFGQYLCARGRYAGQWTGERCS